MIASVIAEVPALATSLPILLASFQIILRMAQTIEEYKKYSQF